ncbi:MAG: hypothetical protein LBT52_05795 [Clostridiales Family XIII bacterium]|jgi:ABC-2 type transport system permease protein|nr:hypothetical protein [Clostridiales Family XIII bacterium]
MQSTTFSESLKSPVKALVRENLRRFWPIALVGALLYFFSGSFLFLSGIIAGKDLKIGTLHTILNHGNPVWAILLFALPIVVSVSVFRYLHSSGAAAVMHSIPAGRRALFTSGWISGLILSLAPALLNALLMIPFVAAGFGNFNAVPYRDNLEIWSPIITSVSNNYPDGGDLMRWFLQALIITLFVFAISAFTGVVTGRAGIHIVSAVILNFMAPTVFLLTLMYLKAFRFGYPLNDPTATAAMVFHPQLWMDETSGTFDLLAMVLYLVAAAVIAVGGYRLYRVLKSERAGESVSFLSVEYVLVYLVTFIGMAAGGMVLDATSEVENGTTVSVFGIPIRGDEISGADAHTNLYIGAAIGAVLTFLIAMMAVRRTPRVFNLITLKRFGVYAVLAVVFLGIMSFDITGYERRVPEEASVKRVGVALEMMGNTALLPYNWGAISSDLYWNNLFITDDSETIGAVSALHREIIARMENPENADVFRSYLETINTPSGEEAHFNSPSMVSLNYDTGSYFGLHRQYPLAISYFETSDAFGSLVESKGFKDNLTVEHITSYERIKNLTFFSVSESSANLMNETLYEGEEGYATLDLVLNKAETEEFAACLDSDFKRLSYGELTDLDGRFITFDITYYSKEEVTPFNECFLTYTTNKHFTDSIAWLTEHGYYDKILDAEKEAASNSKSAEVSEFGAEGFE